MAIVAHALSTVARVKSRLDIPVATTDWDALIAELINGSTDLIEAFVGRRFLTAVYTNELYSITQGKTIVYLRHWPVTAVSSAQYRAGTPDNPNWTTLLASEYELKEDGRQGAIKLYTSLGGINCFRITYTAGYTIDFTAGDTKLPFSISEICEKLVVKAFKKRTDEGKSAVAAAEGSTTYTTEDLSSMDQKVLRQFQRPIFV